MRKMIVVAIVGMMTAEEIAYVAGLLEGEGCFTFNHPKTQKYPKIRMETTDYDVACRVQSYFDCGTIRTVKKRKAHWKQSYVFQISAVEQVREALLAIRPWMSERRAERIDLLLSSYD